MPSRRPRDPNADELARKSNEEAERIALLPHQVDIAESDINRQPVEPDYRARGTAAPADERLPFRLKGG